MTAILFHSVIYDEIETMISLLISLTEDLFNFFQHSVFTLTEFALDIIPYSFVIGAKAAEDELEQDLLKVSNVPLDLVHNAVFL